MFSIFLTFLNFYILFAANFTGSQYQFDFGDGTISPWKPSSVFTYLFSKSGYYRATASAKTTPGITVSDDKVLQVLTPAYGVFFDVPVVFESSVATSYPIAVREGTNMTITVVSSSGTISAFSIAGKIFVFMLHSTLACRIVCYGSGGTITIKMGRSKIHSFYTRIQDILLPI